MTELTDAAGALAQAYEYDAWGIPTIYDPASSLNNRYLFTGREWDASIALYYYRARHYDPALGRFLQTDPAGYEQTVNLYAYCASAPTSYVDPTGMELWAKEDEREILEDFYGKENIQFTPVKRKKNVYEVAVSVEGWKHLKEYCKETDGSLDYAEELTRAILNPFYRWEERLNAWNRHEGEKWIGRRWECTAPVELLQSGSCRTADTTDVIANPKDSYGMSWVRILDGPWADTEIYGFTVPTISYHMTYTHAFDEALPLYFETALLAAMVLTPAPDEEAYAARVLTTRGGTGATRVGAGPLVTVDEYAGAAAERTVLTSLGRASAPTRVNAVAVRGTVAAGEAETLPKGSFSILDWSTYPKGLTRAQGPFRLLEGGEYKAARNAANAANRAMHQVDPALRGLELHEIHPVKFGGSPVSPINKAPLTPRMHLRYTTWWNNMMRSIRGK